MRQLRTVSPDRSILWHLTSHRRDGEAYRAVSERAHRSGVRAVPVPSIVSNMLDRFPQNPERFKPPQALTQG
jgi:hypothetical protein